MPRDHFVAIDQGTTSSRVVIYNDRLSPVGQAQAEILPSYPKSGWVEHDANAIIQSIGPLVEAALLGAGLGTDRIAALGVTNQRETTVVWEKHSGRPIAPALVWQDRRTADFCESHRKDREWLSQRTGLVLDPYFSATKIRWILDHIPNARAQATAGELLAGTIDTYLLWHLTGREAHVTDVTNASRTLLMDIRTLKWADDLCAFFDVPRSILPEIRPSACLFGRTQGLGYLPDGLPISGVAGDQQASLVGQACFEPGQAKCTYGTGAFLLAHTGKDPVFTNRGLLTTLAATFDLAQPEYAVEGSVFVAGAAVQWFRDGLKAVGAASEIDQLSLEASPESDVIFVPALTGLGAPFWEPNARGTIFGLTRATSVADLARATLEGVAFQVADLINSIEGESTSKLLELRVDGGMARSDPFLQFQADVLGLRLCRSPETESTALGAALLAGLGVNYWKSTTEAAELLRSGSRVFQPSRPDDWRQAALTRWQKAVQTVRTHYGSVPSGNFSG